MPIPRLPNDRAARSFLDALSLRLNRQKAIIAGWSHDQRYVSPTIVTPTYREPSVVECAYCGRHRRDRADQCIGCGATEAK